MALAPCKVLYLILKKMFYYILSIWLLIDFITKYYAVIFLENKVNLFWNFIYLQQIYNPWIAFWIEIPFLILKILTIILIIWIYYYYRIELTSEKNKKEQNILTKLSTKYLDVSFWLILSWALWNAYWRIFNEKVIDFIWIKYFSIFNLADTFITSWAIILIYYYYKTWLFDQKK